MKRYTNIFHDSLVFNPPHAGHLYIGTLHRHGLFHADPTQAVTPFDMMAG